MKVDLESRISLWACAPLGLLLILLFLVGHLHAQFLTHENGPIELTTALFYLAGVVVSAVGFAYSAGTARAYFGLWTFLCLVFFGEETSWLQHQIGYATPEIVERYNAQGEFNLHNLEFFHGGALLGPEGELGWRTLLKSQHLYQLGFASYFLGLPILALLRPGRVLLDFLRLPYPGWRLVAFIWIPIGLSIVLTVFAAGAGATKSVLAETREMLYALSILMFLMVWRKRARKTIQTASPRA